MTTPEQQARELLDTKPDHLAQLLHFVEWERENNPQASGQKHVADWAYGEIVQLRNALKKANDQAERFEREWYLRGDELDRLRAGIQAALVEIELDKLKTKEECLTGTDERAKPYQAGMSMAFEYAADIVRKHTGVTP